MPILYPGQTVIAKHLASGKIRECVLDGRNGCCRTTWLAHYTDDRECDHVMLVYPDTIVGIKTECGVQKIFKECL